MNFEGVYTALITPFLENGKIDYGAYAALLERQIDGGVRGVVPTGTTGESPTLDHGEHRELIRKTVEIVDGRVQVIAGTGSNSTAEAISLTASACSDGVDAVMLVNPYYNKPNQQGLFEHFKKIAEISTVPVVLYNIKGRTAVNVEAETMEKLADIPNIKAVKEASGDLGQMIRILNKCGERLALLSGDDNIIPAVMGIGGRGVVSVLSNLYPRKTTRMIDFFLRGDFAGGNVQFYAMLELINALSWETNPIGVKAAAECMGLCRNSLRLPLVAMEGEKRELLCRIIKSMGEDH